MAVTVRIPTPLRKFTDGQEAVSIEATTISEMIAGLESAHGGVKERICDADGAVRRFVNIFVNGEDIRFSNNLDTVLADGDEVTIVPAIAGGCA